jgi:hypothetical protein
VPGLVFESDDVVQISCISPLKGEMGMIYDSYDLRYPGENAVF